MIISTNRIAKHIDEYGLQQLIQLGDGVTALGTQRVGLVKNRRDAALLGERRKRNLQVFKKRLRHSALTAAASHPLLALCANAGLT